MNRRTHRTFLKVQELEQRDLPSAGLLGMERALLSGYQTSGAGDDGAPLVRLRRVVGDAVAGSGHTQAIGLTSFQWGVGRGITSPGSGNGDRERR
jgi:hypothetical protein